LGGLASFMSAGIIGYAAAYYFSPGSMSAVHLERLSPILVHLIAPAAAFAWWILWKTAYLALKQGELGETAFHMPLFAARFVAATVLAVVTSYWIVLQKTYFWLLPPNAGLVYKKLEHAPYAGHPFITSSYAAPTAVSTGTWAYIRPEFFEGIATNRGMPAQFNPYMWFADREHPRYSSPDFAMCFRAPSLQTAVEDLRALRAKSSGPSAPQHCHRLAIRILQASSPGALSLLDYDRSVRGQWSVIEMHQPPAAAVNRSAAR
jgi:hypothetical protein